MLKKKLITWTLIAVLLITSAFAFAKAFNDADELPLGLFRHWWGIFPFAPLVLAIMLALMTNKKDDDGK